MKEIIDKISSYNLFNFLFPGVLYTAICESLFEISFRTGEIFVDLFVYYAIGLVISRIGSILVEPAAKAIGLVNYSDYKSYIEAERRDEKIMLLLESANTYRTLFTLVVCVVVSQVLLSALGVLSISERVAPLILALGLGFLFAFSWRKQVDYVRRRVEKAVEQSAE